MCGSSVPKSTANVALATVLFCGAAEIFPGSLFRWCSGTTLSRMWGTLTPRVPGIVCSAWRLVLSRLSASRNMNSSSPCSDGEVGRTHHIHTSETHTHTRGNVLYNWVFRNIFRGFNSFKSLRPNLISPLICCTVCLAQIVGCFLYSCFVKVSLCLQVVISLKGALKEMHPYQ